MKDRASENAANSPQEAGAGAAAVPGRRWRRALVPGRRWRRALLPGRRWLWALVPLAAAGAVIAVVVVAVAVTRGPEVPQGAGTLPSAPAAALPGQPGQPAANSGQSRRQGISPNATSGKPSAYRVAGTVTMEADYLDCITDSVCYAWFTHPGTTGSAFPGTSSATRPGPASLALTSERTSDGGATWQKLASPPDGEVFNDAIEPSCPTAAMCVAVTGSDTLAVTTNSGASWRLDPLPAAAGSAGWIDQVTCATALQCVVHVSGGLTRGTFFSTTNGGVSWTAASHVPSGAPGGLQLLRCDPGGQCIGAASAGLGTAYVPGHGPGLKIMRSADGGLTWSAAVINNVPPASSLAPGFLMSCGDALHCLYAGGSGVAITSDGGLTWRQPPASRGWQDSIITSVSCTEKLQCSVALAPELAKDVPVIETTSDGVTWTAQPLPSSPDDPLQYVSLLSCPSPGGCVGLASTLSQERLSFTGSGGIVQTSPQMLISSLGREPAAEGQLPHGRS